MIRFIISALCFLLLILFETTFVSSIYPIIFPPLVFATGIFLLQSTGSISGIWWIIGRGFFFEIFNIGSFPFQWIFGIIYSLSAYFLARHFFSNRSIYGVFGCALSVFLLNLVFEAIYIFVLFNLKDVFFDWYGWMFNHLVSIIVMLIYLWILFSPLKKLESLIRKK